MRRKINIIILFVIISLTVCGCDKPKEDPVMNDKYIKATVLLEEETTTPYSEFDKYSTAKEMFEDLGDYKDSQKMVEECNKKLISSALQIGEDYVNKGDIWGAKNWLIYKFKDLPPEINEFLQKDIFNLIADWEFASKGTSLRIDLASKMGHVDIIAKNASSYNTGYWKIKDNKLYFCDIIDDQDDDSNYKNLFTIVSYTSNTLVIKNSHQSFTLTKK